MALGFGARCWDCRGYNVCAISALAPWQRPQEHLSITRQWPHLAHGACDVPSVARPPRRSTPKAERSAARLPWGWACAADQGKGGPVGATRQEGLGKAGWGMLGLEAV